MKVAVIYPPITCIDLPSLTGLYICNVLRKAGLNVQYIDLNGIFYNKYFMSNEMLCKGLEEYRKGEIDTIAKWAYLQVLLQQNANDFFRNDGIKIVTLGEEVYMDTDKAYLYIDKFIQSNLICKIEDTEAVCLQVYSKNQLQVCERIIQIVRKIKPDIKIILGGEYLFWQKEVIAGSIAVCRSVVEIVQVLTGKVIENDVVFEHEYEYSEGFKDYYIQSDVFPIMINASCCYSQCKFCYNGYKINNIKSKDISRLSFEIEYIMEKYKKTKFRFWDECLTPKDIIAVVKLLSDKKYKIKWYINTRFSSVLCNNNIVRDMHKTGCMGTFLGVECASDTALAKMNKNTNVELVYNVLRCLKSNGISTHISLLYGYPGITEMEYLDSKAFICENIDLIDFIDVNWLFETKYNNCQPDTAAIVWYNDMQHIVDKHNKRPYKWRYAQKWRGD